MKAFYYIALNTFRETVRNNILYNILLIAGVALVLSMSFGDLSLFSRAQVISDFGLATMTITGLLLAIFIGVGLLGKEISSKSIYMVITKPVSRVSFLLGKFCGLLVILILNLLLVAGVFFLSILLMGTTVRPELGWAVLMIIVEMGVMISVSIFFSTFTSSTLAAIFTIGFYITGHLNDLVGISAKQKQGVLWNAALKTIYYIFPNLEHFNIRTQVIYNLSLPEGYIGTAVCYGLLYMTLFVLLSIVVFTGKDL